MRPIRHLLSFLLVTTFFASALLGQGAPIAGTATIRTSPAQSEIARGETLDVGIEVDLNGVTGQKPGGGSTPAVLGGYQVTVTFDRTKLQLAAVSGGASSGFTADPTFTNLTTANANGFVKLAAQQTSPNAPTGRVSVARLSFATTALGAATIASEAESVASAFQTAAGGGSAGPAPIPSGGSSATVTIGDPPAAPAYVSPADGAPAVAAPVKLVWDAANGATSYDVYFGTGSSPSLLTRTSATNVSVNTIEGTRYNWRVVARNAIGSASGPTFSFTTAGVAPCDQPAKPALSASATSVASGEAFTLSWSAAAAANSYVLQQSNDPSFASTTSYFAGGTAFESAVEGTSGETRYYRVAGRNTTGSCDLRGSFSNVVAVAVGGGAPPAQSSVYYIPVVGSTAGSGGSFFRTTVQLHNPTASQLTGKIVVHVAGTTGTDADPSLAYSLQPNETKTIDDLLPAMGLTGLASADLVPASGGAPLVVTRIFNDGGASGTSGMTELLVSEQEVLRAGRVAALIAAPDPQAARVNIGVRSVAEAATITFIVRDSQGIQRTAVTRSFAPNSFAQTASAALLGIPLTGSDTISLRIDSGAAIVYGAITDNVTQDPSMQVAR